MLRSSCQSLADRIDLSVCSKDSLSPFAKHTLIYFVPGNPGFIEYYRNLLTSVAVILAQSSDNVRAKHKTQYHIHGESLPGFDFANARLARVLSLDDIKQELIESIRMEAERIAAEHEIRVSDVSVVLVGHSIGAWLILEAITELQKNIPQGNHIARGILLFPTVLDLAKSPNGLRFGWMLKSRYAAFVIALITQLVFAFIPLTILGIVLQVLLQMPQHHAVVTASMLKSRRLVEQALYMAHGEMQQVTADTWSDDLWGVQELEVKQISRKSRAATDALANRSALYFYWGMDDHWVADYTRDTIIARRARTDTAGDELKPVMEVDKHGLPHAFPLVDEGADLIAGKIVNWL